MILISFMNRLYDLCSPLGCEQEHLQHVHVDVVVTFVDFKANVS